MTGKLLLGLLILLQVGGASPTYDRKSNRTGEIKSAPGSYEIYDKRGNRIGTGRESPIDGSIRVYDPKTYKPLYEIRGGTKVPVR